MKNCRTQLAPKKFITVALTVEMAEKLTVKAHESLLPVATYVRRLIANEIKRKPDSIA